MTRDPGPSRTGGRHVLDADLASLDAYCARLGDAPVLTPAQETALAKEIEHAELGVALALVAIPSAVRELAHAAEELRGGKLQLGDVTRCSGTDDGLSDRAQTTARTLSALGRVARLARAYHSERTRPRARLRRDAEAALAELRPSCILLDRVTQTLARSSMVESDVHRAALATANVSGRAARRLRARLVRANLRLVVSVAMRYRGRGIPLIDLVQEGNLGLVKAVDRFDHRRGYRLATFATWWIRQSISRALDEKSRPIRIPGHMLDACARVATARRRLANRGANAPTPEEIADLSGLPVKKVAAALVAHSPTVSLDADVSAHGEVEPLGDRLTDPRAETPFDGASARRFARDARQLLNVLSKREREIVRRRFGLEGRPECTLQEIGRTLSLTRERVRQIERAALAKLRAPRQAEALRTDLER